MTRCPQATMRVAIELNGQMRTGYSGDCLPPSWFDKSPDKDFAAQVADMLRVIQLAETVYADQFATLSDFFDGWFAAQDVIHRQCQQWRLPPLLASFGSSLLERAILDAACRRFSVSFAQAIRLNLFGLRPEEVHPSLARLAPADWLPPDPLRRVFVRQTVGLGDPLTLSDVPPGERLHDGWPQAIEEYMTRRGVRYFKIKVSNRLDQDLDRLTGLAELLGKHLGKQYWLTLDGNEQYKRAADFAELVDAIRSRPGLETLWDNILAVEQPFDRNIALDVEQIGSVSNLAGSKPIIIDESDGTLHAFAEALEAGYRGVSSKNCKGAIKSIFNAGLIWLQNDRGQRRDYLMTGEDLCSVGVIPTQSDLCLAATLGLEHVERNGHHYHPGLTYLPKSQQAAALAFHGDFYREEHGIIGPSIVDGRLRISSLQCAGFGFGVEPDMAAMEPAAEWRFESLAISN